MNTAIRNYINEEFKTAPKTKRALELKEELIANAEEKLTDLIAQGHDEDDSAEVVIHSIGNVKELFPDLEDTEAPLSMNATDELTQRKKYATIRAISTSLLILAAIIFLTSAVMYDSLELTGIWSGINLGVLGFILGGLLCIIPAAMRTYANYMMPSYQKRRDDIVEEYKEWKSQSARHKSIRHNISTIIWLLTTILYFIISFTTAAWYITWVIFLAAGCVEAIVTLLYSLKE
jgi:energy-coupling factor transporter transmembrane protein EcfT